jgi:predicted AAA+ superfamily ATPase
MTCYLAAADTWPVIERQGRSGALVEIWATAELRRLIAATGPGIGLWYWRPHARREVDLLLEQGEALVAVEVKWSQRISEADVTSLHRCARDLKNRVYLSVLLYPGTEALALDSRTLAVPFSIFFRVD